MLKIYVDADACPVKNEVYRVADRHALPVLLVANAPMRHPESDRISLHVVSGRFDAADDWIVDRLETADIVVTGDIPLASRALKKGAAVIGHSGRPFTEENIGGVLATREILAHLRSTGEMTGGPKPFQKRDRSRFLDVMESTIRAIKAGTYGAGRELD